jgi:hypothetical protein
LTKWQVEKNAWWLYNLIAGAPSESGNHLTVAGCSNILALSPLISLNGALTNGTGNHSHHQPEVGQIRDRKEISHLVSML